MTEESHELIELNKINAIDVFTKQGLDPLLASIHAVVDSFVPDIDSAIGRAEIASLAYKIARSKTFLDEQGKQLGDEARATIKAINGERTRLCKDLDELKVKVRKPLTEYEAAEKARVLGLEHEIEAMRGAAGQMQIEWDSISLDTMRSCLAQIEAIPMGDEHWQEFAGQAAEAKDTALSTMRRVIEKREAYDADKAENERLREEAAKRAEEEASEAEARADREREERIRKEAAEKAEGEAEERRLAEAKEQERKEQARLQSEEKARQEAEQTRLAAEKDKADALARAVQADADAKAAAEKAEQDRIEAADKAEKDRIEAADKADKDKVAAAEQAERNEELAALRERERLAAEQKAKDDAEVARKADEEHRAHIDGVAVRALVTHGIHEDLSRCAIRAIANGEIPNVKITY